MPKITLNLEDTMLQGLKIKSSDTKQCMSELVNDALEASLQEDLEDTKYRGKRAKVNMFTVTKSFLYYSKRSRQFRKC
ncbi:hypothetical protein N9E34_02920 [Opitutales bacterium]|nr:hypothetical protein [Opitutales bacterium]